MFGLPSPSKLLVLAIIVGAVWYGFKWIGQAQARAKAQAKNQGSSKGAKSSGIDTVVCPKCGTYYDQSKGDLCGGQRCANTG